MSEPIQPAEFSAPNPGALAESALSRVRQEPTRAMGSAFVIGLLLSVLPVGRIFSVFVSLAVALLRPALVIFGALKLWEEVGRRRR